jgi:hypothetical protein
MFSVRNRTQVLFREIKKEVENSHWWMSGRNALSWRLEFEHGDDRRCQKKGGGTYR